MAEKKKPVDVRKYERSYDYDDCTIVWKFDTSKTNTGPFEVEIKYKKEHVCGRGEGPREDDVPGGSAKLKHKQKHVYGQGESNGGQCLLWCLLN